jgi:hypothetical protein
MAVKAPAHLADSQSRKAITPLPISPSKSMADIYVYFYYFPQINALLSD